MSDNRFCDRLCDFFDGELDNEQAQAFRRHLAECKTCPDELEGMLQLASLQDELQAASRR